MYTMKLSNQICVSSLQDEDLPDIMGDNMGNPTHRDEDQQDLSLHSKSPGSQQQHSFSTPNQYPMFGTNIYPLSPNETHSDGYLQMNSNPHTPSTEVYPPSPEQTFMSTSRGYLHSPNDPPTTFVDVPRPYQTSNSQAYISGSTLPSMFSDSQGHHPSNSLLLHHDNQVELQTIQQPYKLITWQPRLIQDCHFRKLTVIILLIPQGTPPRPTTPLVPKSPPSPPVPLTPKCAPPIRPAAPPYKAPLTSHSRVRPLIIQRPFVCPKHFR